MAKQKLKNIFNTARSKMMRGATHGAIAAAAMGAAATVTSCDHDRFDEIREFDIMEITDANIAEFQDDGHSEAQNLIRYKNIHFTINHDENIDQAMRMALILSTREKNIKLKINSDTPLRFERHGGDCVSDFMAFHQFVSCVALARHNFNPAYGYDFDGDQFILNDSWEKHSRQGTFDLTVAFNTIDLEHLGYYISRQGSMTPLVDMIHILESAGFNVANYGRFPELVQALAKTKNPYVKTSSPQADLYISPKMMGQSR